ncbi:MAG: HD domain-containing protein [FCB group bacterium]|nr:HD domain-containing protein [FCB group bacterium]
MTDTDKVTIKTISGRFFLNDQLIVFDKKKLSGADAITNEWDILGIGGVEFHSGISLEEVEQFFVFIAHAKPNEENLESLTERLRTIKLSNVQLLAHIEEELPSQVSEEKRQEFRKKARKAFFTAMSVVREVMVNTGKDKEINISKTKRVIHSLIDHLSRDESSLLELTAIKNFDDYTYIHSTNVCVYALTLGVRLGLDRSRLSQLGFTALFHDIGKVKLPADLIRKPDAFDENDWVQMQLHPILGAKTILRNFKFDNYTARAMRGAFEHHINKDFTGYPMLRYRKRPLDLFSKIISVVDTFDALTSGRVYIKKAIPPEKVLQKMRYQMKVKFDEFLLKIFHDIVGIYPVGSLVLLNTDEIALVLANNEKDKARPYIKIVGNREGLWEHSQWVDLFAEENRNRKIVRQIEPQRYGLDIKDFVLTD